MLHSRYEEKNCSVRGPTVNLDIIFRGGQFVIQMLETRLEISSFKTDLSQFCSFYGSLGSNFGLYIESDAVLFLLNNVAAPVPDCSSTFVSSRPDNLVKN